MTDSQAVAAPRTYCGRCKHPMHWRECGAESNATAPCYCRNDGTREAPAPSEPLRAALIQGYVLVSADMLAAAIGSLPSPPSVLHPEESAAAILSALKGPAR